MSRIGYEDHTTGGFDIQAGDTLDLTIRLVPEPVELDRIHVAARREPPAEFWERKDRLANRGIFITREEIEEVYPSLSFILQKAPGVHTDWTGPWNQDITFTPPGGGTRRCSPIVYVNGHLLPEWAPLSEWIDVENLIGVEIYRSVSFSPDQYRSRWNCGVVLLWTRPPPERGTPVIPMVVLVVLTLLFRSLVL